MILWNKGKFVSVLKVTLAAFLFCLVDVCYSIDGNRITETPAIDCQSQRIKISIKTQKPFGGRIYLKGNSHRKECVTEFAEGDYSGPINDTKLAVAVDYNLCNTERIRTLSPSGVTYSNTLVVQFHKIFITTGDKAYHIRCFYSEVEKTVTQGFDVSMVPTESSLVNDMDMPICDYSVRRDSVNGPIVRTAQVGDSVYHRWECTGNIDTFGMLVHSCYVENSSGEKVSILDENGCSLDQELLPQLEYNENISMAYSRAKVFKYPDNSFIHFRCQMKICTKLDGSCVGLTPPDCERRRVKRSMSLEERKEAIKKRLNRAATEKPIGGRNRRHPRSYKSTDPPPERKSGLAAGLDVITREILVFDENEIDGDPETTRRFIEHAYTRRRDNYENISPQSAEEPRNSLALGSKTAIQICANRVVIICIMAGFFLFFASAISFIVYLMVKHREKSTAAGDSFSDIYGTKEPTSYADHVTTSSGHIDKY